MNIQPALIQEAERWNNLVIQLPRHHLLQSWQWGQLKADYGWEVERWAWLQDDGQPLAAAQLLHRSSSFGPLPLKFSLSYCPRGPVLDWTRHDLRESVLNTLQSISRQRGAAFLKIDPDFAIQKLAFDQDAHQDITKGQQIAKQLSQAGWRLSPEQIQFRNTAVIDLTLSEDNLLMAMKQKTRYNVRLAGRKGVEVRQGGWDDLDLLYDMYAETSLRDGFVIRPPAYYRQAWGEFIQAGLAQPFIAEVEGQPVAAVVIYRFGEKATYMYGMSRDLHRNKMPAYLLQWEAMLWAKSQGCRIYDFWGAPDVLDESDPMWGVYRFKQGFAPTTLITPGAWDWIIRPVHYWAYTRLMPILLELMRRRGRRQTMQSKSELDL
jgi:lipid II:glycine glycyltransferase (peptidoglycan interpeptide bridge formation enzyme)